MGFRGKLLKKFLKQKNKVTIIVCLNTSLGSYWHTLVSMYSDEEQSTEQISAETVTLDEQIIELEDGLSVVRDE